MRPAHLALLIVLNVFWAATLSVYKVLEPYLAPGGIVTVRFALAGLPIVNASAQFFLTFAAMVLGMCVGMLGGCEAARRLALRK